MIRGHSTKDKKPGTYIENLIEGYDKRNLDATIIIELNKNDTSVYTKNTKDRNKNYKTNSTNIEDIKNEIITYTSHNSDELINRIQILRNRN